MTDTDSTPVTLRETIQNLAPGTALREGLDRIVLGRTGALIVLGDGPEVLELCDGGFGFDVPFAPNRLRELSKMDGAVILSTDGTQIKRANVQLVPSPAYATSESGTRHRSAERTALQTGRPVVAVSQSMNVITLYVEGGRHVIDAPSTTLNRANQALGTLERYRSRLDLANQRLFVSEVNNYATVTDAVAVLQRELLVKRVGLELDRYVLELGTDGRQLNLQLTELRGDNDRKIDLLIRDYLVFSGPPSATEVAEASRALDELDDTDLLKYTNLARILGLPATEESLSQEIVPRGYRTLSRVPRVQLFLMDKVVAGVGDLTALLTTTEDELATIENVGPMWARHIHEGLGRLNA